MKQLCLSLLLVVIAVIANVNDVSADIEYRLNANFDNLTSGIPTGWDNTEGTTTTLSYRWNYSTGGHSGGCLKFDSYSNSTGNTNFLKTPVMDLSTGEWLLKFWYKNPNGGDFSVYISTDSGETYTTALLTGLTGVSDWTYQELSITAVAAASSEVCIVFKGTSNWAGGDAYIYLDDVTVESAPDCKAPVNLSMSNLTTTSATVNWGLKPDGATPGAYYYRLRDSMGTILAQSDSLVVTGQSYDITGLTANTTYSVELAGNCNNTFNGFSSNATISFTTLCYPQAAPYDEDYDGMTSLPNCSFYGRASITNGGGRTGNCLQISTSGTEDAYVVFPELTSVSNTIEATMFVKVSAVSGGNSTVQIGLCTDPADVGGTFTQLYTTTLTNTAWNEIRLNTAMATPPTPTTMIAVIFPKVDGLTYFIDDVSLHTIPTCVRPEQFTLTDITAISAEFSWTQSNAANHNIYACTATDTTIYTVGQSPATISGLTPNTSYTFYIRGICSASDSSELNPYPITKRTMCVLADSATFLETFDASSSLPSCWTAGWLYKPSGNTQTAPFKTVTLQKHSGSRAMSLQKQTSGTLSYMYTQCLPVDSAGKYMLSVWVYRQNAAAYPLEGLKFWVNTAPDDTTGGTLLGYVPNHYLSAPAENSANRWYNYEFLINRSGNLFVIIEGISQNGKQVYFDDVEVKLAPSCVKVKDITLGAPTTTDVDLTWTAGKDESQWIVNYTLTQGSTVVETVTDTVNAATINIDSLTSATSYNVTGTVTSYCGGDDLADAVSFNCSFVTACEAMTTLPYLCGFESAEVTSVSFSLPYCWSRYNDAAGSTDYYPYVLSSAMDARTGSGTLYFNNTNSTYADYGNYQVAVLPEIDVTANPMNTLRVVFYAKTTTADYGGMLYVGTMSNPHDVSTFTAVDSFSVVNSDYMRCEALFNNYTGTGTYMAMLTRRPAYLYGNLSIYVDDVTIGLIPTCLDLAGAGVMVSSVTDTSALVTLTDQNVTAWTYAYGPAGTPASACTAADTTGGYVRLTGLTPQTDYVVYARRKCSSEYGAWSDAVTFRTACTAAAIPFVEDFESHTQGLLGGCYTVTGGSTFVQMYVVSGSSYNNTTGGSNGISTYEEGYGSTSTDLEFNVLVKAHLESGKNYDISAYAKTGQVYYGVPSWILSFVIGSTSSTMSVLGNENTISQTSFTRFHSYFTVQNTGDYYIGIRTAPVGYDWYIPFVDDIKIEEVGCIQPTSSTITGLTSTTASVDFVSNGSAWEVAVSASPIDIEGEVTGEVYHDTVTAKTFTVNGLSVNTPYYYTIRTICSTGGASAWMTPQTFRTHCSAYNLPYQEGFENIGSTICWNLVSPTGSVTRDGSAHNTGNGSMLVTAADVTTPEFNITTLAPYMLTGWAYSATAGTTFNVGVMLDPSDPSSYEPLTTVTIPTANSWTEFTVNFDTLNSPDYSHVYNARYILISTGQNVINFDDMMIDIIPTCPKPTEGSVTNVTGHTATIDWTETGSATSWVVRAVTSSGIQTVQTVTSHPYTLTGLNAATGYTIYVSGICTGNDTSYDYKLGVFTTDCDYVNAPYSENFEFMTADQVPVCWDNSGSTTQTVTGTPHYVWGVHNAEGNNAIRMYNYLVNQGDALINTPEIILEAGKMYELRYDHCNQASCGNLYVKIKRHSQSTFTQIGLTPASGTENKDVPAAWLTNSIGLSSYAGDTVQIQFQAAANYGNGAIWVDNVRIRELSSCLEPVSVTATNVGATYATVIFNDTCSTHTAWQYAIGTSGFDINTATPVDITSDTIRLTSLNASTSYDVYVRAVCSVGDYSSWNMVSFKTTSTPAALPYVCDFTDNAENAAWEFVGSTSNAFTIGNDANAAFSAGGSALYVSNWGVYGYDNTTMSITGATRVFAFGSSSYNIEFDWKCPGGESGWDFARFYLLPAATSPLPTGSSGYSSLTWPSGLIALDGDVEISMVSGVQHVQKVLDMTGREGSYNLVFVWASDGYPSAVNDPLAVSNINISELTCQLVTDAEVISSSITETTVQATCTNPNAGSTLRWAVGTSTLIGDTIMSGIASGDTITVTGLTPSTSYYMFFRAECSAADLSPWVIVPFNTACGIVSSYPFVEGFERTTFAPNCWTITSLTAGQGYGASIGTWERYVYTSQYYTYGNGNACASIAGGQGASALLTTPTMRFEAGREYHLSFTFYHINDAYTSYEDELDVYVGPSATSKVGAVKLGAFVAGDPMAQSGIVTYDLDIPANLTGDYHIIFEGFFNSSYTAYVYIDDVTVDVYPECRELTNAPTVVATTSTTVAVSEAMGASHSEIQFGIAPYSATATSADITTIITSATGIDTFTMLTASTSYSIFARSICATTGDTTAWTRATRASTKADDCFAPDGVRAIGMIADTTATIGWNTVPNATSYECIFSALGLNDTMVVTTNRVSTDNLLSNTEYTFMVRANCSSGTTSWSTFLFQTITHPAVLPYVTGFEATDDNSEWIKLNSARDNNFVIGNSANGTNGGAQGLYISNNGSAYAQSLPVDPRSSYDNVYNVTYATRTVFFSAAGNYSVDFDWRCDPTTTAGLYYANYDAYGRAFVTPSGTTLPVDDNMYKRTLPAGAIALGGTLTGSQTWQRSVNVIQIAEAGYYDVVFMWYAVNERGYAEDSEVSDYPLAIDNVTIDEVQCLPVNTLTSFGVSDTIAYVAVNKPNAVDIDYALLTVNSADSITSFQSIASTSLNDTICFTGLTPTTTYYCFVREICDPAHLSNWISVGIRTTAVPASLPYVCDFENATENGNWQYTQVNTNQFVIGSGTSNGGTQALYISDDGATYQYDINNSSYAYAYRVMYLPAGLYEYGYDWKSYAEGQYDYGRAFLLPSSVTIPTAQMSGLSVGTLPSKAIALDHNTGLISSNDYVTVNDTVTISEEGSYNLVFAWVNDNGYGNQPPLAIDNIRIALSTCQIPIGSVVQQSITETSATAVVLNMAENSQMVYAVSPTGRIEDAILWDTLSYNAGPDTLTFTNLSPSSGYVLMLRSICGPDDVSMWKKINFKTLCGAVTSFPYVESFETLGTSYRAGLMEDICWSDLNSSTSTPSYYATNYCGYTGDASPYDGNLALYMTSGSSVDLYFCLPEMNDINSLKLSYVSKVENTSSSGTVHAGYMTNPSDGTTFVSLYQTPKSVNWTAGEVVFTNVPAGARIAFKYGDTQSSNYYGYIDMVRVSEVVQAPAVYDTICHNTAYTQNGFNVAASDLQDGDNVLTRIEAGAGAGAKDTVYVANVYMRAAITTTSYDTTCAGVPYVKGRWNITDPVTKRYQSTFKNASVHGCDSTVELYLTVVPTSSVTNDTICQGDTYLFVDTLISTPGMYTRSYTSLLGCTNNDTLYLMVTPDTIFETGQVCEYDLPYEWRGQSVMTGGRHYKSIVTGKGCAQTAVLDLTVYKTDSTCNVSFCQGGSVQIADTVITSAGTYTMVRVNPQQCAVIYHITATETAPVTSHTNDYACEGRLYTGYGISYLYVTGDTTVVISTKTVDARCDSISNVHLTYVGTVRTDTMATISGANYTWHGNTYSKSGEYHDTLRTVTTNCDSIVTLHLTLNTGVEYVGNVDMRIVPNPVNSGATAFVYGEFGDVAKVEILSNYGQLIESFEPETYPIEVRGITAAGIYYVRITTKSGQVHLQKLMVK